MHAVQQPYLITDSRIGSSDRCRGKRRSASTSGGCERGSVRTFLCDWRRHGCGQGMFVCVLEDAWRGSWANVGRIDGERG